MAWTNLEIIMLNEIDQSQQSEYFMPPLIHGYKKKSQIQRKRKWKVVASG